MVTRASAWRHAPSMRGHLASRRGIRAIRAAIAVALILNGCAIAAAPIADTPDIVASPQPGQLDLSFAPATPIGDVQPVYLSIANGTDTPRTVVPSQIFALNAAGGRVAPLPPGEGRDWRVAPVRSRPLWPVPPPLAWPKAHWVRVSARSRAP